MNISHKPNVEQKQSDTKDCVLHNSIYIKFKGIVVFRNARLSDKMMEKKEVTVIKVRIVFTLGKKKTQGLRKGKSTFLSC